MKAAGPVIVLGDELAPIAGIEAAFVFGSWAARYLGDPGPAPRDIDLLIVGAPSLDDLYAACRRAEAVLGIDVNPVVRTSAAWSSDDQGGFLDDVRSGPIVPVLRS